MKPEFLLSLGLAALAPLSPAAEPAAAKQQARAVFEAHQNSVIVVSAAVAMNMGGGPALPPQEVELTGTVLTLDGQVAVSLSAMDPSAQLPGLPPGMTPPAPPTPYKGPLAPPAAKPADAPASTGSAITNIKLFFPGGGPVPGKIVLRDAKTDLLLLQSAELPKQKITPVPLENGPTPALLDDLVFISRQSPVLDRALTVTLTTVDAIIEKPEPAWHAGLPAVGGPVFNLDGKLVGLALNRILPAGMDPVMMGEEMTPPIEPVIIPAAAILKAMQGKRESDLIVPLAPKVKPAPTPAPKAPAAPAPPAPPAKEDK